MIPKIIHFCWLSGDPYPEKIQNCIDSWDKNLPDYTIVKWDMDKCSEEGILNSWVIESFSKKKYAFAADFIRLYAVYKYGGIYLDSDVEVIKTFDNLLELPYFIGRESKGDRVEMAAFGAEQGCPWVEKCMSYYLDRHFILPDGSLDMTVMPDIIFNIINSYYEINNINQISEFNTSVSVFNQFPKDWFCANVYLNISDYKPTYLITHNTYCIHHFANSWIKRNKIKLIVKSLVRSILLKFHK